MTSNIENKITIIGLENTNLSFVFRCLITEYVFQCPKFYFKEYY